MFAGLRIFVVVIVVVVVVVVNLSCELVWKIVKVNFLVGNLL